MIKTTILTISDTRTKENDDSGKTIIEILNDNNFTISNYEIIKDDLSQIKNRLIHYSDIAPVDLILTTGGTGIGPRDVTPEATLEIIEKRLPGIGEHIRATGAQKTKNALLSRGKAGVRKNTLIINLPGSPKGAGESLEAILGVVCHAIEMMRGAGH
ncbi:MAG: MogA/MoaB family molybdenum cofactor biosynthesis protein [Candidatus Omnitrophota bacterium]|nr:MogA/MoaB family molybdenum cofactor biosynthesis protein [Candidatus Omnitrophota bacterium]